MTPFCSRLHVFPPTDVYAPFPSTTHHAPLIPLELVPFREGVRGDVGLGGGVIVFFEIHEIYYNLVLNFSVFKNVILVVELRPDDPGSSLTLNLFLSSSEI